MATATAATWTADVTARCDRCLGEASVAHLRPVAVHGVVFDVCVGCIEYLQRQHVTDRARALRRLLRTYGCGAAA